MRKRIIASLAIIAVFGPAIAAYAFAQTSAGSDAKTSCCAKSDSCPMKGKMKHEGKGEHATSCPMKSKAENASMTKGDSCCDCCGASCPMKKGEAMATAVSTSDAGKDCCDNCKCCKGKHKTTA